MRRPRITSPESMRRKAGGINKRTRFRILQRDGFRCRYCGRSSTAHGVTLHVDHVVPVVAGGPTTDDNLVTACSDCNLGKGGVLVPADPAAWINDWTDDDLQVAMCDPYFYPELVV